MIEQPATNKIRIVEKKPKVKKIKKVEAAQANQQNKMHRTQNAQNKKEQPRLKNKKDEASTVQVSAKVIKVATNGLEVSLEDGRKAFLPKENMHIGKKKKLEEIFSEGYAINAFIKTQKGDKITLTQKEATPQQNKILEKDNDKKTQKASKKQKKAKKEEQVSKISEQEARSLLKEQQEEVPKQKTLKDLKKLQSIGNMKISVGRGKKSNLTKLAEEKNEEPIELPKVPEGLLENIITSTKEATERFSNLTEELSKRNLLQGNIHNE